MSKLTFRRKEHLKSRKAIGALFRKKQSVGAYPIRWFWLEVEEHSMPPDVFVQVAFSVPKRKFKKAVDRNRIRRQLIELYRIHKADFLQHCTTPTIGMFVYTGKEKIAYKKMERAFLKAMHLYHKSIMPLL